MLYKHKPYTADEIGVNNCIKIRKILLARQNTYFNAKLIRTKIIKLTYRQLCQKQRQLFHGNNQEINDNKR